MKGKVRPGAKGGYLLITALIPRHFNAALKLYPSAKNQHNFDSQKGEIHPVSGT
jgi:hypothetical protein